MQQERNTPDTRFGACIDAVMMAPATGRQAPFAEVLSMVSQVMATFEAATFGGKTLLGVVDISAFIGNTQSYLRALSTYPMHSDEWLSVFRAFRDMFEGNLVTIATHDHLARWISENRQLAAYGLVRAKDAVG